MIDSHISTLSTSRTVRAFSRAPLSEAMIEEGSYREDLFFRINVILTVVGIVYLFSR